MASTTGGMLTNLFLFAPVVAVPVLAVTGMPTAPPVAASSATAEHEADGSPSANSLGAVHQDRVSDRAPGGGLFEPMDAPGQVLAMTEAGADTAAGSGETTLGAATSHLPGTEGGTAEGGFTGEGGLFSGTPSAHEPQGRAVAGNSHREGRAHGGAAGFPAEQRDRRATADDRFPGQLFAETAETRDTTGPGTAGEPADLNSRAEEPAVNWSDAGDFDPRRELLETSAAAAEPPAASRESQHGRPASIDDEPLAMLESDAAFDERSAAPHRRTADISVPAGTGFASSQDDQELLPFEGGGTPSRAVAPVTWTEAVQRLNALGIHRFQLQPGRNEHEFHFSCLHTPANNPRVTHRFEAEAGEPLRAVQLVLQQIQEWQQQ